MPRSLELTRTEAVFLIDVIEEHGAFLYLADELRAQWGMGPRPAESNALGVRLAVDGDFDA